MKPLLSMVAITTFLLLSGVTSVKADIRFPSQVHVQSLAFSESAYVGVGGRLR